MRSDQLGIPRFRFAQNFRAERFPSNGESRKIIISLALRKVGEISEGGSIKFKLATDSPEREFDWGYLIAPTKNFATAKAYLKRNNDLIYLRIEDTIYFPPYKEGKKTKARKRQGHR